MFSIFYPRAACASAAGHCKEKEKNISKLALQFSLKNQDIATTLVGMNSVEQVILLCMRGRAYTRNFEHNQSYPSPFSFYLVLSSVASRLKIIWFS